MTYQESIWQGKTVLVIGILSKSGKLHMKLKHYVGRTGIVNKEAKNGMLLIEFKTHFRSIPAGCIIEANDS